MAKSLTSSVVKGAFVKLLGGVPMQLIGLFTTLLCFRFLEPKAFGAYSVALAIYGFSDIFTNPGVATYLIRDTESSDRSIDVAFTLSVLRGAVLTPIFWLAAPLLSAAFEGGDFVTKLLRIMCLGFFLSGLKNLHVIRFHQRLQMGRVLLVESLGAFLGAVTSVVLLYLWRSPLGLVFGSVTTHGLTALLSWAFAPSRARFVWDRAELARLWKFTRFLLANSLIIYALLNLDDLLVARLAGLASLGLYSISYNMVNSAVMFLVRPLHEVVLPALARVKDDLEKLRSATLSVVSTFSSMTWMICASLWVVAADLFIVLGHEETWAGATPVFRALLPFVLIRGINGSMGQLLLALGKPNLLTLVSGGQLILMVPLGYVGFLSGGFLGLVVAITVLNALAMLSLLIMSRMLIGARMSLLLGSLFLPAASALGAAGMSSYLLHFLQSPAYRLGVGLAVSVLVFVILWEATCRLPLSRVGRQSFSGLVGQVRKRA